MKTEIERHMLPRPTAWGMTAAAALTVVAVAAVPAQADPQIFIGLQAPGVNGGAITMFARPQGVCYGTFSHSNNIGQANPADIPPTSTLPLLSGATIDVTSVAGRLVVWMTGTGNLGANLPSGHAKVRVIVQAKPAPRWLDSAGGYLPRSGRRHLHYRHSAVEPSVSRFRPDL